MAVVGEASQIIVPVDPIFGIPKKVFSGNLSIKKATFKEGTPYGVPGKVDRFSGQFRD